MEYTNVLTMLDLGGIPLRTAERSIEAPLVIAGGPCVFSPEPMADFIDAFVIGDGEEAFPQLVSTWMRLKRQGGRSRDEMLVELARITGVYVPSLVETRLDTETGFHVVRGVRDDLVQAGVEDLPFPIRRAVVDDINRYPFPTDTLVPFGEIVHDRVSVEIARGCTEGCRFCQAGIIYRPVRERTPEEIIRTAEEGMRQTGYNDVSLTSLSTADYSCVTSLVKTMMDRFVPNRTAMSVSSMRVYGLTSTIAEQLARVRRTGFTIAPEAGTQRMRDIINKGVTEADIEMAARIAWEQGWSQLKMYFMIGLPTETDEDVLGIAETGIRVQQLARRMGRKRASVTVSASALVPKPHSTFQWQGMDDADELVRKQRLILEHVRPHRNVRFKYHDVPEGVVECILSRGDRRLGAVILRAWRDGARFDSWNDHFDVDRWMRSMQQEGLDPQVFLRPIPIHAALPWDHIDTLVSKEYLIQDLHKSQKGRFMPACEKPFIPRDPNKKMKPLEQANLVCYHCGLECDLDAIKRERIAARDSLRPDGASPVTPARSDGRASNAFEAASGTLHGQDQDDATTGRRTLPVVAAPATPAAQAPRFFYRVRFSKSGDLRWLSHLDLMRALQRAFKRAVVPVAWSRGYHPAPLMSFGPALAVGIEGFGERFDFESNQVLDVDACRARLNDSLPPALRILELQRLPAGAAPLSRCVQLGEYRAWWNTARYELTPELFDGLDAASFEDATLQRQRIQALLQRQEIRVLRQSRKGDKEIDLRPFIADVSWIPESRQVRMLLRLGSQGQARPREVLEALYDVPGACFRLARQDLVLSPGTGVTPDATSPVTA
jgi:radical SAM family uncharacterized protein/radical SAM-linked protein